MLMLTKMKIALVIAGSLLCGVAAAAPGKAQGTGKPDFKAKKAEMMQKFDANKDGKLDQVERTAMHEERVLTRFKKLDTDGNGSLSLTEFKAGKQGKLGKAGKRHARGMHRGFGRGMGGGHTK
jgi:hypothetical protein